MFELKRTDSNNFCFIECNPRIWGSIHQGLMDGVDYFLPLLGPAEVKIQTPEISIKTALFPLNLLAAFGYWRTRQGDRARDILSGFSRQYLDIHPFLDPFGILALLLRGK
ncbi:MAG: hypothetical protein IPL47_16715 [Phyllobacteriaceae bacterium]|nr:hypothetical protein [Phyllobacteriaceae bacterium]